MKTIEQFRLKLLAGAVIIGLCTVSISVFAAGQGKGGGGKPGGETAAQNLSVPTIMIGGSAGGASLWHTGRTVCAGATYGRPTDRL